MRGFNRKKVILQDIMIRKKEVNFTVLTIREKTFCRSPWKTYQRPSPFRTPVIGFLGTEKCESSSPYRIHVTGLFHIRDFLKVFSVWMTCHSSSGRTFPNRSSGRGIRLHRKSGRGLYREDFFRILHLFDVITIWNTSQRQLRMKNL